MVRYSRRHISVFFLGLFAISSHAATQRFVENPSANNVAVVVGASNGLMGIEADLNNMEGILKGTYEFQTTRLYDGQSSVANIETELTRASEAAEWYGTLLFYFSGHGSHGLILADDLTTMTVEQIRAAIVKGREKVGPLARLVLIYDSCHSGSMMDPMRQFGYFWRMQDSDTLSSIFADKVVEAFTTNSRNADGDSYWKKLFVFASSQADETSLAGADGSVFTNAFTKAFKEVSEADGSVATFIQKTQEYTVGHHPVTRLVPATVADEKLVPHETN